MHTHTRHDEMDGFPTVEDFKSDAQVNAVIKWRDLPLGVYKIVSKRSTTNKFGPGMRLELRDASGEAFFVWAPARLVESLSEDDQIGFILNEGLKQSMRDPSKSYFAFSTVQSD